MKLIYSGDKLAAAVLDGEDIGPMTEALKLAMRLHGDAGMRQKLMILYRDLTTPAPDEGRPA